MRLKILVLAPLLGAMGSGIVTDRPPPPPVALPQHTAPVPASVPGAAAQSVLRVLPAADASLEDFLWQARPVVIFADTPANPSFLRQIAAFEANPDPLVSRDVVVITDADPAAASPWRRMLRPEGFSLVLLDKDGQVKLRKPAPWDVREITRSIDKFPSRREEIGRSSLP